MEKFQIYLAEKKTTVEKSLAASPAAAPGAVPMQIAPGGLLHSNMIDKKKLQEMAKAEGVEDQHNEVFANLFLKLMTSMMTPVAAPAASSQSTLPTAHQTDLTLGEDQVEHVMGEQEQLTDDDTDTEQETNNANGDSKKKAKTKISKADKKKKAAAVAAKAKAAADAKNAD